MSQVVPLASAGITGDDADGDVGDDEGLLRAVNLDFVQLVVQVGLLLSEVFRQVGEAQEELQVSAKSSFVLVEQVTDL